MAIDSRTAENSHALDHGTSNIASTHGIRMLTRPKTRHLVHNLVHEGLTKRQYPVAEHTPSSDHIQATAATPPVAPNSTLMNKTWIIHKTTPFYNFDASDYAKYEVELLTYIAANARILSSSALAHQTHIGTSTFVNEDRRFPGQIDSAGANIVESLDDPGDITRVQFELLSLDDDTDDRVRNTHQGSCFMIHITVRPKGKTREQTYFCAILTEGLQVPSDMRRSAFTNFSLILLKTPVVIGQLVTQWLERKFDCRICRLLLQSFELRRIVNSSVDAMYNHAQGKGDMKERPIELHYTFPVAVEGLRSVSVSLPPDEARQLLVSREEDSKAGFLDGVEAHCSTSMKIDFGRLNLSRAGCASWFIASEGKVKMFPAITKRHSIQRFVHAIVENGG